MATPVHHDALRAGTILHGYSIRAVLGGGGFGVVYQAHHRLLGNLVAIKEYLPIEMAVRVDTVVRPRSAGCEPHFREGLRRFLEEGRLLLAFDDDPVIVKCRDLFEANGTAYLVMEYESSQSLSDLLRERESQGKPLSEEELLALIVPLTEGLGRLHAAGVLHRDIKPGNILVRNRSWQPVLIDFGAAKQTVAQQTKSLAPLTPGYAALEQVGEGNLGPWTDVYGLGAVMWRIVAGGNPPWSPPNPVKVESRLNATLRENRDPLSRARQVGSGRFSKGVLNAIDGCLVLRETERIQTCEQLLRQLRSDSIDPEAQGEVPEVDHLTRYLLKSIAGLIGAMFYFMGKGIRESIDVDSGYIWLIAHIIGMLILYLVFFRWSYTMNSPLRDITRHRIPLAVCWYVMGAMTLVGAFALLAIGYEQDIPIQTVISSYLGEFLGFDMVILAAVSIISATGILYRAHWAMNTVIILSFISSASIGGLAVAWYTWWVASSSSGKANRKSVN